MCELFGLSSKNEYDAAQMLTAFFSHADENPHGWGLSELGGEKVLIEKEPVSALNSERLENLMHGGIRSKQLLAHIRYATKGSVSPENTHPFTMRDRFGDDWVLVHNGTIFECDALSKYSKVQQGETDSERILYYLMDKINAEKQKPSSDRKIQIVENVIRDIVRENKVNIMISDGDSLYVHSNFRGSMYYLKHDGVVMAASRKLEAEAESTRPCAASSGGAGNARPCAASSSEAGAESITPNDWQDVPLNTLMVFREGEEVYRGTAHSEEFFFDEEKRRLLFLDYAGM